MEYFVFGFCALLLVAVAILAVKIVRENRKLLPPKKERAKFEEDEMWR